MADAPLPEYDHCGGPDCCKYDDAPVDLCTCDCDRCVAAREWLLRMQGDDEEHGDPSGNGGAGPVH